MWQVNLQEGKDCNFLKEFKWHTKTSAFMICMTKPIGNTRYIITMDSGYSVASGILALHDVGVNDQSLIRKHGPFCQSMCLNSSIDDCKKDKEVGFAENYKERINLTDFLVHC